MRIGQGIARVGIDQFRTAGRTRLGDRFSPRIGTGSGPTNMAAAGVAPLATLGAVLAVQQADDALARRRRARQRGEQLLDSLEQLHLDLLGGRLTESGLKRLQKLAAEQRERSSDPVLDATLDEIELRAAVELAKLERR